MRLATFNLENLFERAAIMNLETWADGKSVLDDFSQLNDLISHDQYSDEDKAKILEIAARHKGLLTNGESKYLILRDVRGKFKKQPKSGPLEIVANGRTDWIGWFELKKEPIKDIAIENTARVIREINADIQCVVEVENRTGLKHFNEQVISKVNGEPFDHVMLIDGNDDRGIDVGILLRGGYKIESIVSHVDDTEGNNLIFSRDCPEYSVLTPSGTKLLVMINHLKSKGYGTAAASNAKREKQASRARQIYDVRISEGWEYIVIAGDFNDTPDSDALSPLLSDGSKLVDIMAHPAFSGDDRPGTFANGTSSGKIDYILMSPKLAKKVKSGGIERRGVWGGKNGTLFPHFPEMKSARDAASDHAALWAELDI